MICTACRERHHDDCRGGSWCACQHQVEPVTPEQKKARERPAGGEPPVNWVRQG